MRSLRTLFLRTEHAPSLVLDTVPWYGLQLYLGTVSGVTAYGSHHR
jgi:hypothetical protein